MGGFGCDGKEPGLLLYLDGLDGWVLGLGAVGVRDGFACRITFFPITHAFLLSILLKTYIQQLKKRQLL